MNTIQDKILSSYANQNRLERSIGAKSHLTSKFPIFVISMVWDLTGHIDQQAVGLEARGASEASTISIEKLGQAITLTGSTTDAEAVTCLEYLDRIWPESGRKVLELVQTASKVHLTNSHSGFSSMSMRCMRSGISRLNKLSIRFRDGGLYAMTHGELCFIIEVVQILVWLSSTFRESGNDTGVISCTPSINYSGSIYDRHIRVEHHLTQSQKQGSGQCWHSMLHHPIVVVGYPVRYRSQGDLNTGLEISLPIIASLIQSTKVIVLDGKLFIKGFSAMLVPTAVDSETIRWHYMFDADGDYLPFDATTPCTPVGIDSSHIGSRRHIVGWCSEAKINVGKLHRLKPVDYDRTSL